MVCFYRLNPLRAAKCAMPLVVMMHESSPGEELAVAAFKHHADPTGLIHSQRVGMMDEWSPGE